MQAGLIGLGAMGQGMARNLAASGFLKTVFNRTLGTAEQLALELNILHSSTPAVLAAQVDVILLCVSADQDVLEMVTAVSEKIKPGSVVVDMSTVSSATAKKAATILKLKQVDFLDAPVSGGVEGAKNSTLSMMVGGDSQALDKIHCVLECMTSRIVHIGDVGSGQATKAVNQIMAAGINQAVTEALAFGHAQGLPMEKVVDVIARGAAGNWFLSHRGTTMLRGTYVPGFKLALHHKDLKICRHMAAQSGITSPIVDMTIDHYETLIDKGFGDEDISALYRLKKPVD